MNYSETLEYLYSRLPMFHRIGKAAYKPSLDNTWQLMALLDHPQQKFKSIHVAGTNGKGSSSHLLASIFQEAGYKTGLYTSPHLVDFRERIQINGIPIAKEEVVAFVAKNKVDLENISPSFFEWTVGLAFQFFAKEKVDIAIIETGLGGRLDSTNVIEPELSLITNIGWDHMDLLGDTLPKIAAEKAGIIKPYTVAVINEALPETRPVFEQKAHEVAAPVVFSEDLWEATVHESGINRLDVSYARNGEHKIRLKSPLSGWYQVVNFRGVLECVCQLQETWGITRTHVLQGFERVLSNTHLRGRWEMLAQDPLVIADTGHNADGWDRVMSQLHETGPNRKHLVLGAVSDKDISHLLTRLPRTDNWQLIFTQAQLPRALPAVDFAKMAKEIGLSGEVIPSVDEAVQKALENARNLGGMVFIGGSTFVVGEAIAFFDTKK